MSTPRGGSPPRTEDRLVSGSAGKPADSPVPGPQSPATPAKNVRQSVQNTDVATGAAPASRQQGPRARGDLLTHNKQTETPRAPDEILNSYLAEKDPRTGIPVLIKGVVELIQHGKVTEGINLLNVGHTILVRSGITPDRNPYVTTFAKSGLYCWACDQFMATVDGKLLVCQCVKCRKTFCPSHADKAFLSGAKCPLCKSRTPIARPSHAKLLWNRYFATFVALTSGILFAFFSNLSVTSPERVLSAPNDFVRAPFEFRYVSLANTQVIADDREKALVMLDLDVQNQPFKVYGAVSPALLQELQRAHRLCLVKGNYGEGSGRYVFNDVAVSCGWLGSVTAGFYQATKLAFSHRLAVMTASFGIWFVASAIWTLFKMSVSEEIGELADIGMDLGGDLKSGN